MRPALLDDEPTALEPRPVAKRFDLAAHEPVLDLRRLAQPRGRALGRLPALDLEPDPGHVSAEDAKPQPRRARTLVRGEVHERQHGDLEHVGVAADEHEIVRKLDLEAGPAAERLSQQVAEFADEPREVHLGRTGLRRVAAREQRARDAAAAPDLLEDRLARLDDLRVLLPVVVQELCLCQHCGERVVHRVSGTHRETPQRLEASDLEARQPGRGRRHRDLAPRVHDERIGTPESEP